MKGGRVEKMLLHFGADTGLCVYKDLIGYFFVNSLSLVQYDIEL